ncbi:DUF2971 domain-containing protein [Aliarcobacter cryaerophilus]|uniref:DUF2971 domain-containing protein n=1 Tax=Aliarcobacter cryaerophilus TaxID=28198 RepID=UPI0021B200AE|nr:DUF2971 domain-containing protein [Aliarcobacter cryaerophilus]MCT7507169.1 DUF2971 domain-containing protein [Aliarcobacter cryaerophilus]
MIEELDNFLNSDDAIFHYTKKETAMEYILSNKQLKLGMFRLTNDPYEYKKRSTSAFGWGDINQSLCLESMSLIDSTIHNTSFLSFCGNSNNKGYKKSRMWSQYGQNHSGICLVFSKESLMTKIQNELSEDYFIYGEDVNYKEIEFESLNIEDNNLTKKEIVKNNIKKDYKQFLFQKDLDYQDENEFRIVLIKKNLEKLSPEDYIDISDALRLIILGDKFPEVYLPIIQDLSTKLNIKFKQLDWERNRYFLLDCNINTTCE